MLESIYNTLSKCDNVKNITRDEQTNDIRCGFALAPKVEFELTIHKDNTAEFINKTKKTVDKGIISDVADGGFKINLTINITIKDEIKKFIEEYVFENNQLKSIISKDENGQIWYQEFRNLNKEETQQIKFLSDIEYEKDIAIEEYRKNDIDNSIDIIIRDLNTGITIKSIKVKNDHIDCKIEYKFNEHEVTYYENGQINSIDIFNTETKKLTKKLTYKKNILVNKIIHYTNSKQYFIITNNNEQLSKLEHTIIYDDINNPNHVTICHPNFKFLKNNYDYITEEEKQLNEGLWFSIERSKENPNLIDLNSIRATIRNVDIKTHKQIAQQVINQICFDNFNSGKEGINSILNNCLLLLNCKNLDNICCFFDNKQILDSLKDTATLKKTIFGELYNTEGNKHLFKIVIVGNQINNHAMVALVPNDENKKILIFNSSLYGTDYDKVKKMDINDKIKGFNEEFGKNIVIINDCVQENGTCTYWSTAASVMFSEYTQEMFQELYKKVGIFKISGDAIISLEQLCNEFANIKLSPRLKYSQDDEMLFNKSKKYKQIEENDDQLFEAIDGLKYSKIKKSMALRKESIEQLNICLYKRNAFYVKFSTNYEQITSKIDQMKEKQKLNQVNRIINNLQKNKLRNSYSYDI